MHRWSIQEEEGFGILVEEFNIQMKKCEQQNLRCGRCVYMRRPQHRYTSLVKKKYICFKQRSSISGKTSRKILNPTDYL